jgi:hypothetical protein
VRQNPKNPNNYRQMLPTRIKIEKAQKLDGDIRLVVRFSIDCHAFASKASLKGNPLVNSRPCLRY